MTPQDLFVGTVAIGLGTLGLAGAIGNWDAWYELKKIRWIESIAGRSTARAAYCVVGLGLIALGTAIASGLTTQQPESVSRKFRAAFFVHRP